MNRLIGGIGQPYQSGQSEEQIAGQQKRVVQCQDGGMLLDEGQELAIDHAFIKAGGLQPRRKSLQQINGCEPPPPEMIRQMKLMKGGTPKEHDTLQSDAESAGNNPQKPRLFGSAYLLIAGQSVKRQFGQWRKKRTHKKAEKQHGPKNLIEGFRIIEQAYPIKGSSETKKIEAGQQAGVEPFWQPMHQHSHRHRKQDHGQVNHTRQK